MFSIKLDNPKSAQIEPQFYPQNWEVYDAATDSPQEATEPNEAQATETVDDDIKEEEDEGQVIEEVNPEDFDSLLAPRDANISSRRSTRTRKTRKSKKSRKTRKVNLPAIEEIIVKSESEIEATVSSQLPISQQVSPTNDENRNVNKDGEIKEEDEEGPMIEEVNPDDYPLSPWVGNTNERAEIAVEATQETIDAFSGNESTFAEPVDDTEDADDPIIEEVNPDDYPLSPWVGNAEQETEASHLTFSSSPVPLRRSARARKSGPIPEQTVAESAVNSESLSSQMEEEEGPMIEEVNPDDYPLSPWVGNGGKEAEMGEEETSQMAARVGSVSPAVLRRSSRVRKSAVNYALLPEAEEDAAPQDDPNTGSNDAEESDSDESETETEMETETGDPRKTEEGSSIEAGRRLSRKTVPCRYCGKKLSSKQNARHHENIFHHQIPRPRPYVCSQSDCGKAFLRKSALDRHSFLHSGLRPFTCATCDATFTQRCNLTDHQRTHTDARPYACTVCLKGFKAKKALVQHRLLHSGVKPFTCDDCGDSFTQRVHLKSHRKGKKACASRYAPSERRPFSCTVPGCGKAYKDRSAIAKHLQAHSGLKPFSCTVCGGTFTRKESLTHHRRTLHGL